jgi:hypothetical protein
MSTLLNAASQECGIVVHRRKRGRPANRYAATAGAHGWLSTLFNPDTLLTHNLLSLRCTVS